MTLKMKREQGEELIKRLRSGKYKQGEGFLNLPQENGESLFCCLGVLCEMATESGAVKRVSRGTSTMYYGDKTLNAEDMGGWYNRVLPPAVIEWAGVESAVEERGEIYTGTIDEWEGVGRFAMHSNSGATQFRGDFHLSLASLNDSGMPFDEIAQFIEDNVEFV